MRFDAAQLDILTPSDEGKEMTLISPRTGKPVQVNVPVAAGEPARSVDFKVKLLGKHSTVFRDLTKQMNDEAAAVLESGKKFTQAMQDAWDVRRLAACTRSWALTHLDNAEIACTAPVAEKVYADPRFVVLFRQGWNFVVDDGNFFPA